jgi:hypothetical protein
MIDNNIKIEILVQKSNDIEKRRQRFFTIILAFPITFFLLKNSMIQEVNFNYFSIKHINILLFFFPSIFSLLLIYTSLLADHNSKLTNQINYISTNETDPNKQYQKEKWLNLIKPINFLSDILGSIKTEGMLSNLGFFFVYTPLIFAIVIYTLGSFVYFLFYNFQNLKHDCYCVSLGNIIFSIWLFIGIIIYQANIKKTKISKDN